MSFHASTTSRIKAFLDKISGACLFIASCSMVVLIVTFGWLVFGRYILNSTPTWVEQLALVLIGYIAFLGAAVGVHEDTHLGVTMFRDALGLKARATLLIACDLILTFFGAVMFLAAIELMRFGWDTLLPMLNVPESVRTLSKVLCGGLIVLFSGARAILRILTFPHFTALSGERN